MILPTSGFIELEPGNLIGFRARVRGCNNHTLWRTLQVSVSWAQCNGANFESVTGLVEQRHAMERNGETRKLPNRKFLLLCTTSDQVESDSQGTLTTKLNNICADLIRKRAKMTNIIYAPTAKSRA